jgi:hypothetical protein
VSSACRTLRLLVRTFRYTIWSLGIALRRCQRRALSGKGLKRIAAKIRALKTAAGPNQPARSPLAPENRRKFGRHSAVAAFADLRSRPSIGTVRLPSRAKRPTGGGRGGGVAVSRPSGSCGRRPRGLLREQSPCRPFEVGIAPDRRSARAAPDQDVAGLPVEDTDDRGRMTRTTEARDKRRGITQGSSISPLLANIYMRRFVLGWKMFGLERTLGSRLVTYADDLVILCRRGKAEAALQRLREIMGKLKLSLCRCESSPRSPNRLFEEDLQFGLFRNFGCFIVALPFVRGCRPRRWNSDGPTSTALR